MLSCDTYSHARPFATILCVALSYLRIDRPIIRLPQRIEMGSRRSEGGNPRQRLLRRKLSQRCIARLCVAHETRGPVQHVHALCVWYATLLSGLAFLRLNRPILLSSLQLIYTPSYGACTKYVTHYKVGVSSEGNKRAIHFGTNITMEGAARFLSEKKTLRNCVLVVLNVPKFSPKMLFA